MREELFERAGSVVRGEGNDQEFEITNSFAPDQPASVVPLFPEPGEAGLELAGFVSRIQKQDHAGRFSIAILATAASESKGELSLRQVCIFLDPDIQVMLERFDDVVRPFGDKIV